MSKFYSFIPQTGSKYIAICENTEANREMIYALNKLAKGVDGASLLRIRYRGPMSARRIGRVAGYHNSLNEKARRDCLAANATHFVVYRIPQA